MVRLLIVNTENTEYAAVGNHCIWFDNSCIDSQGY